MIYVVTVPLDLELATSAPLVLTRTERFARLGSGSGVESMPHVPLDVRTEIGGRVRDRKGALLSGVQITVQGRAGPLAVTNASGEFALAGLSPGPATLQVQNVAGATTLVPIQIPSDSYDIVAD